MTSRTGAARGPALARGAALVAVPVLALPALAAGAAAAAEQGPATPTVSTGTAPPAGGDLGVLAGRLVAGSAAGPFLFTWTAGTDGFRGEVRVALPEPWGAPSSADVFGGSCLVDHAPSRAGRSTTAGLTCPAGGTLELLLGRALAPDAAGGYPVRADVRPLGTDRWTPDGRAPDLQVVAGPPARLTVHAPSSATAGALLAPAPAVEVRDALGNPCTGDVELGGPDGSLSGPLRRPLVDGRAVFTDVRALTASAGRVLVARAGDRTASSTPFPVLAGPAVRVVLRTASGTATSGTRLQPGPVLEVVDAGGNRVDGPQRVRLTVQPAGGAVLGGTTDVLVERGRAALDDLVLTGEPGPVHLVAAAPPLQPGRVDLVLAPEELAGTATLPLGALSTQPAAPVPAPLLAPLLAPLVAPAPAAPGPVPAPPAVAPAPEPAPEPPRQVTAAELLALPPSSGLGVARGAVLAALQRQVRVAPGPADVPLLCTWAALLAAVLARALRRRPVAAGRHR